MLKRHLNYASMFVGGVFFCVLGFSFIFTTWSLWNWLYLSVVIGIAVVGILRILNFIFNFSRLHHRLMQFLDVVVWIVLIILSLANAQLFYFIFPRLVGGWILLHALVKMITITIKIKDHLPGWLHSLIFLCGDLIMAFILLFMPYRFTILVDGVVGCYFIIYGGNLLLDFIREIVPSDHAAQMDHRIRLAVPPFLAAVIPPTLMRTILAKDAEDQAREEFEALKADIPIDLEVFVHMAPKGPAMLGHVDIAYRGFLFSYGCYDPHQRHLLGTMGDGVVLIAPRDTYIRNCIAKESKVLVGFGIHLNAHQKACLNQRLLDSFALLVDFHCDEELKQVGLPYFGACDDYLSRVTRNVADVHYYKYKEGKFKTFFVLSANCVFFITHLLGSIGLNLVDLSGIVSPGSYFDFLNKQFKSDKSFVISRHVYTKRNLNTFFPDTEMDGQGKAMKDERNETSVQ